MAISLLSLPPVQAIRPYPEQSISAQHILTNLEGSYLLETSSKRALQDPLAFELQARSAERLVMR